MSEGIGNVPEGWQEVKLGDVVTLNYGKPQKDAPQGQDFPIYGTAGIVGYTSGKLFNGPSVIVGRKGTIDKPLLERGPFWAIDTTYYSSEYKELEPYFLLSFLQIRNLAELNESSGVPSLGRDNLYSLPILLPPLPEQQKIAAILSAWDDSIATLGKLLAAKQQQKRGLAEELLTGKRRLKGFVGEWEEKKLGEVLCESRIAGTNGAIARKLTVKLWGKGVQEKQEKLQGSENTKYFKRSAGQLIFSKLDFLNGAFGIIPSHLDGLESTLDLPCFDFLEGANPTYILEYISRDDFYSRFESGAIGGRKARRVTPEEFLKTFIPLPPLPEQQAIASILSTLDDEILALTRLRAALQQQKRGLMDVLLTGRVRVSVSADL